MSRLVVTKDKGAMSPVLESQSEAFGWLLRHQSSSVSHALEHEGWAIQELPEMDDKDLDILRDRQQWLDRRLDPGLGDFVTFSKGHEPGAPYIEQRISHVWQDNDGWDGGIQTSKPGTARFYLGPDYISMSGSLEPCIPSNMFRPHGEKKAGKVWFFHHHQVRAHNGVDVWAAFRRWWVDGDPRLLRQKQT